MFAKNVNRRSRKEMVDFLSNHFRYDTMNSWNQATSYANNIKLSTIPVPDGVDSDTWYGMLEVPEWHEIMRDILERFAVMHNWEWQIGSNGRSGGYLVLYQGGRRESQYKSRCTACGQKNYKTVEESGNVCGACHNATRVNVTLYDTFTHPGRGVDMDRDYSDWDMSSLRDRVLVVSTFDTVCDAVVEAYIYFCKSHRVEDDTILVPRKIKVAVPR